MQTAVANANDIHGHDTHHVADHAHHELSFIRKYIQKDGVKLVSKLNNKIIVQNDDSINIFSLKSESESKRFLTILEDYMLKNKRLDCIIVSDDSTPQKKYLYSLLESKGISKLILYKKSTTFFTGE